MNTFIRFVVVGVIATAIHYAIYYPLILLGLPYLVAYGLGYLISFCANYLLSSRFTFQKKSSLKNASYFSVAHIFNYFLQSGLMVLFVTLGVPQAIAPFCTWAISVPSNFFMVRFAFSKGSKPTNDIEQE